MFLRNEPIWGPRGGHLRSQHSRSAHQPVVPCIGITSIGSGIGQAALDS